MYKIGGIIFCFVTGILIANFGWMCLLWSPLGFFIGLIISAQVFLPIIMGVPFATWLILKGQMRVTAYFKLLVAPIFWLVILFVIGWFFPNAASWVFNNTPLNIAANMGTLLILLSPFSTKTRQDFFSDFNKSYSNYYIIK